MDKTYGEALKECAEKFSEAANALKEAFSKFMDFIRDKLEEIKAFFEENQYIQKIKPYYFAPKKIVIRHQVINRKPRMAVARSRL